MNALTLGIDPGASLAKPGGLCWLNADGSVADVAPMPVLAITVAGKQRGVLDAHCLSDMILTNRPAVAWVEKVGTMPGEGSVGAFAFGRTCGLIEGILVALGVPLQYVTPQAWKKGMGLPAKASKDDSRQMAMRLAPDHSQAFKGGKGEGPAEAFLIGLYGQTIGAVRGAA
jgi:crossover junction endodeoxyribonuclease RuvC